MKQRYQLHVHVEPRYRRLLPTAVLRNWAAAALATLDVPTGTALDVALTEDDVVRDFNRTYRGVDEATDVLSFAFSDAVAPGPYEGEGAVPEPAAEGFVLPNGAGASLGEVLIAYPYAARQAAAGGHTERQEVALLMVHGILHLLGFDHEAAAARRVMWDRTAAVLDVLGVAVPPTFLTSG